MYACRALKFTLVTLTAFTCGAVQAAPPAAVQNAICRPVFNVDGAVLGAGTAFVVDMRGPQPRALLVTALHLFGPAGGLATQIPAAEMARRATAAACTALAVDATWRAGPALTIPGAQPMGEGALRDAAAFVLDAHGAPPPYHLKLAAIAPKAGDHVWLLAQVADGAPPNQLLHRAVVRQTGADVLQYAFDNVKLGLQATSGAPVLNDDGDVVGMHLGGGELPGKLIGAADNLAAVRSLLRSAK